jgi:hypothetical protein
MAEQNGYDKNNDDGPLLAKTDKANIVYFHHGVASNPDQLK